MTSSTSIGWKFLKRLPGQPTSNGDITRMFNTGDSIPPASFGGVIDRNDSDAISALIYGREGIANCFDASQARATGSGDLGLDFVFRNHRAAEARRIRQLLGLDTLAARVNAAGVDRKTLGLGAKDCLSTSGDLRTLLVEERGGGGMPGALDDERSVLAQALINVGEAQTSVGAAGSYGYGKAAVAQASRIRSMIVYTCFEPTKKGATSRRLLGVTYWGMHDVDGGRFTGWTLFGHDSGETVRALEDDEADRFASELGMEPRDPRRDEDLGTTFVIIDPGFNAQQLKGAIELSWWPLLQRTRPVSLDVLITDEDGDEVAPAVDESHEVLGQFVRTFRRAEQVRTSGETVQAEREVALVGTAGITSLEVRDADSLLTQSLIALMRSPLMVVSYNRIESAGQPLVGVFVAHEETNELLRSVEPAEHDKWLRRNVGGLNASNQALSVSKLVVDERDAAAKALRPPDPEPIYGVSAFSNHFPAVDAKGARPKSGGGRHTVRQRLVRVNLVHDGNAIVGYERPTRTVEADGRLSASGEVKFWIDPDRARKVGRKALEATITIGAQIAEEGGKPEWWATEVDQVLRSNESAFERITADGEYPVKFEGTLEVGLPIYFVARTAPYHPDWTLNLAFDCSPWDEVTPLGGTEGAESA